MESNYYLVLPRIVSTTLISTNVSSVIGLLSVRMLLDFRMALSTAVLIADTIKSAYLSRSLVDTSSEKSSEPSAAPSVDSNTSLVKLVLGVAST